MTKMRESTGVILWILVLSFGGLWVLQDSGALDNIGFQQRQNIAVVDGDPITYQEYTQALEQEVRAYQQRSGEPASQAVRDQYADVIYDRLVENKLREREMDRLGIRVTDDEVREMFMGQNPDPIVAQLFPDGEGGVNRAQLQSVVDNPEATADLIAIEDYLRAKRRAEKLNALLGAAIRVTDAEVEAEYVRRNQSASARYVALRYAEIPDSAVTVTDGDLEDYYDENREDFERERTVTIDFVALSQEPSAADSAAVMGDLADLRAGFQAAEDDSAFVAQNFSQTPYDGTYVNAGALAPEVAEAVFENPTEGRVIGPILVGDEARLVKITDVREAAQPAVRARHILIGQRGDAATQREQQLQQAQDLLERIEGGESFETLARQYSQDPGSAARGGELGWFGRGQMVAPFENAAFDAEVGQVVGPVETEFGYHLIQVEERAEQEVQLAQIALPVGTTSATLRKVRDQADDLKYYTEEGGDFAEEAERQGLGLQQAVVQGDQAFIPGLGNSRAVRAFIQRAEAGDISDVIDTGTAFVVVRVTGVQPEGYRPFEEVRAEIEPRVRREKKLAIQVEKLQEALAQGPFEQLPAAVDAQLRTTQPLTMSQLVVPGLGREPVFVGTLLGLDEGQTSDVVAGENAAFVIQATDVTDADPSAMTAQERQQLRNELLTQRRQLVQNQWLERLRTEADIEDNRAMFF
jgi:peptidylprolyl isomerase/peptidyl-prolyl cis-trans isomerase D